jgi:2,4-dienoyl-CoA reductase-like NADH-dependent reductase (Old Yellow Enzyme family)
MGNPDYYDRRVAGEVGLIVSEGTVVNRPASSNDPDVPRFYGDKPLLGWKAVIDKVHSDGGVMAPQLWHMGVVAPKATGWRPPLHLRDLRAWSRLEKLEASP